MCECRDEALPVEIGAMAPEAPFKMSTDAISGVERNVHGLSISTASSVTCKGGTSDDAVTAESICDVHA